MVAEGTGQMGSSPVDTEWVLDTRVESTGREHRVSDIVWTCTEANERDGADELLQLDVQAQERRPASTSGWRMPLGTTTRRPSTQDRTK